ncbi:MAG: hypothetical protein HRT71_09995 [Flavobacteriales bacterium]|nr:hypothetical protein [Flavobacteriales bacterium]
MFIEREKSSSSRVVNFDLNGVKKTLHLSVSRLSSLFSSTLSISIFIIDVTDFYENEQLRSEKRVIEKSLKFRDEFLANMSHEIRTPMNGVIGMLELFERTTTLSDLQKKYLGTIKSSSSTLLSIINDILDLSKMEAGKMKILRQQVRFESLVEETINLFSGKADEKGISIGYYLDKNLPIAISTDPVRLKQVLSNLVSNAIKFTDRGNVFITVSTTELPNKFKFGVQDSGIGMKEDEIASLFTAFSQLDSSSTKQYQGTGLGLAISKKNNFAFRWRV